MKINGDMLRKERESKGFTIRQFSKIIGVSQSSIGMYERGERNPDDLVVKKIADFFDMKVSYFSDEIDETLATSVEDIDAELIDMKKIGLKRSKGYCELCGDYAPFVLNDGTPYLEIRRIGVARGKSIFPMLCCNCDKKIEILGSEDDINMLEKKISNKVGVPISQELRNELLMIISEVQDNFALKTIFYYAFTYIRDLLIGYKNELSKSEMNALLDVYNMGLEKGNFYQDEDTWIEQNYDFIAKMCKDDDYWKIKFLRKDFNKKSFIRIVEEIRESLDFEYLLSVPHYVLQSEHEFTLKNDVMSNYTIGILKDILLGNFRRNM